MPPLAVALLFLLSPWGANFALAKTCDETPLTKQLAGVRQLLSQAAVESSECAYQFQNGQLSSEQNIPACEASRNSDSALLTQETDGGGYPNLLKFRRPLTTQSPTQVENFLKPNPSRQNLIRNEFEQMKRLLVQKIRAGASSDSELNEMQKFLILRVEATPLRFLHETASISPEQRIAKCLGNQEFPDCRVSSVGDAVELKCGAENLPLPAVRLALAHELGHIVDPCTLAFDGLNPPRFKGGLSALPVPANFAGSPFENKSQCLVRHYQLGKSHRQLTQNLPPTQLANLHSQGQYCGSLMKEHFADLVGAELLDAAYENNPPQERASTATLYLDRAFCQEKYPQLVREDGTAPSSSVATYPPGHERLRSFLSRPRIAASLNCGSTPPVQPLCP